MPHATECSTNLLNNNSVLSSSPIPIPGSVSFGRNSSSSSYSASTVAARTTTINDLSDYNCNPLSLHDADNMNVSFDQSYSAVFSSDETMYTPTITSDPVARSLQPSYPRDYNCCGVDHQNLVDLLQHVDNCHPGLINDLVNGVVPFETTNVYSQDRWDSISTIPIPVSSISTPLTTSMPNSSSHELKNNNFNSVTSASLYSVNVPSILNHKQKGTVNNNGLGHPNGYNELGQINGFDQINGLEQINGTTTGQNQDLLSCDWMLAAALLYDNNPTYPLRDPNFSSTLFGDQTLSSNSSSISTSLDDDNSFLDIPSKSLQMNQQESLLVSPLLSISTYPTTPMDACLQSAASSPISSDDNSVVVSPIANDQTNNNISQRHSSSYGNTSSSGQGSISSSDNDVNTANSQQRRSSSHVTTSQLSSLDNIKIEQGSLSTDKTLQRRFLPASSIDGNSQPRRSSTSTIIPSQNEQYGPINMSNLGQGNIRPIAHLRRSSTSNLSTARSISTTTTQAYSPFISIDKNKLAYIPSVTAAQYSVNTVDGYSLVGHVSSGETGSGAVPFAAKYHPIQPKAGVAMSDVYSDPALDASGIKSLKKRTVSTSSIDAKSTKRRVSKPSDEPAESSVSVLPGDLSSEVENRCENDIYPYKCAVPGCIKAYKNANGLKYHNEHGHASQSGNGAREKPWACHIVGCLKTYGSKGGLVYHVKHCHPNDLWALP